MQRELYKSFQAGFDVGSTFYNNLHAETDLLVNYNHDELKILAPKYFIELLGHDIRRKFGVPHIDPGGMFKFMGIEMMPGPYEKIVLYHVDYPLLKREDMIYEFDLSVFVTQHNVSNQNI